MGEVISLAHARDMRHRHMKATIENNKLAAQDLAFKKMHETQRKLDAIKPQFPGGIDDIPYHKE